MSVIQGCFHMKLIFGEEPFSLRTRTKEEIHKGLGPIIKHFLKIRESIILVCKILSSLSDSKFMLMLPPDPIYIFKGDMLPVSCVAFKNTPANEKIYAGTQSGNVHVWNLKNRREIGVFKAGDDTCLSICIPQEEDVIITHTKSGSISFWEEQDSAWQLKNLLKINYFGFCKCQVFDDILYAPIKGSKCDLISVKTMKSTETITLEDGDVGEIMAFKVCDIGKRKVMLVAYEAHKLGLWKLNELQKISTLQLDECPMAVDYDANTNKGLCGDPSDKILIFSLDQNLEFKILRRLTLTNQGVAAVRIRPDGKLVAIGCWDGKVRLYSWKTFVLLAALDTHNSTIQDVSFGQRCTDGSKVKYLLAAGSQDARISLWDLYN